MASEAGGLLAAAWVRRGIGVLCLVCLGAMAVGIMPGSGSGAGAKPGTAQQGAAAAKGGQAGYELVQEARFSERRNGRGGLDWRVIEPRFRVVHAVIAPKRQVDMLLVQRLDSTAHSDAEGEDSTLTVSGWIGGAGRFDRRLWTFDAAADEGGMARYRDFYETTKFGCCGAEDVHGYYSLATGRQVGAATAEAAATVEIPNTSTWRMISYHSANGQRPPQTPAAMPDLLGVLNLGSEQGIQHRIAITAPGLDAWTPRLTVRPEKAGGEEADRLDLWAADGKPAASGIGGFQVHLVFEDTRSLVIPVSADDFDLSRAELPPGFHLVRLDGRAGR